jgi:putative peptidoglycan lipid II flippase
MKLFYKKLFDKIYQNSLLWDTVTTTGWSTLSRGIGFLIPFFIAAWFGVSVDTDAFFFAYGIIFYFSVIFCPVLQIVIVPYIAEIKSKDGNVGEFIGKIFGFSGISLLFLIGLFILISKPGLRIITNFDADVINLIYQLLLEASPLLILAVWNSILRGSLNAHRKFAFPAISPGFRAVINLSIIYFFKARYGIHSIMAGYVIGELVVLIILMIYIKELKIFTAKEINLKFDRAFQKFLKTTSYQLIGMAVVGLTPLINKTMATWLSIGSVSLLDYAYKLYIIPITFMTTGFMVTLLSHWSIKYYEEDDAANFEKRINKTLRYVISISLILMLVLVLFSQSFVDLAFGRGKFTADKLMEVNSIFLFFLFGLIPYMIARVYVRYFVIIKDTKTYLKIALVRNLATLIFNFIFMKMLGLKGLALSATMVSIVEAGIFSLAFKRKRSYL